MSVIKLFYHETILAVNSCEWPSVSMKLTVYRFVYSVIDTTCYIVVGNIL